MSSVHVAAPPLGLEGALVLHVGGVPVDHRPYRAESPASTCSMFYEMLGSAVSRSHLPILAALAA